MKLQKIAVALTVINLVLMIFLLANLRPAKAQQQQNDTQVLPGRAQDDKKYYCAPCGCEYDDKLFDTTGKCPGCGMKLLTLGTFNYEMASISKNGIIVYVSNQPYNKQQLFYKPITSSLPGKQIAGGFSPNISGDGKRILYCRKEGDISLYDVNLNTSTDISSKIGLPNPQTPVWNTTGNSIIFCAGKFPDVGIYTMDLDNEKIAPLVTGDGLRYACVPSPDGKKLAYRCVKGKSDADRQRGIAVYDYATKEEKYVSDIGEYCTWSPDGKRLAFHWPDSTGFCIYTVNADGTGLKKIAGAKEEDYELPSWSADGNTIYFQTNKRNGNWEIWTMNTDGSNQKPLIWKN